MPRSYEEMKRRIEWNVAEIDKRVEVARNIVKEQLEIGFMTPELLEEFVKMFGNLIALMDSRRNFIEYAKILEIDIQ